MVRKHICVIASYFIIIYFICASILLLCLILNTSFTHANLSKNAAIPSILPSSPFAPFTSPSISHQRQQNKTRQDTLMQPLQILHQPPNILHTRSEAPTNTLLDLLPTIQKPFNQLPIHESEGFTALPRGRFESAVSGEGDVA